MCHNGCHDAQGLEIDSQAHLQGEHTGNRSQDRECATQTINRASAVEVDLMVLRCLLFHHCCICKNLSSKASSIGLIQ